MKLPKPRKWSMGVAHQGADYTPEEVEYLRALTAFKQTHGKPFPSEIDRLNILRALGWRKVAVKPRKKR
jgi:hypothetical protein